MPEDLENGNNNDVNGTTKRVSGGIEIRQLI